MKRRMVLGVLACMALIGCQKGEAPASNLFGSSARGRYLGVAVYAPGRMWEQVVRAGAPTDSAAATLKDDEQVIVVVDSATGELRQCGNLIHQSASHCPSMVDLKRLNGQYEAEIREKGLISNHYEIQI